METTKNAPARPFRIIRGKAAGYRTHAYTTRQRRDSAALRFAAQDGERVLTELWDAEHPQDDLNHGWACDGHVDPPGTPAPAEPTGIRGEASHIVAGDTVTVYAADGPDSNGDYTGVVHDVEPIMFFGNPSRRITMTPTDKTRRVALTVVDTAVTYWHDRHAARPDDQPEPGDRCKDCGGPITWDGPSQYDWTHVEGPVPAHTIEGTPEHAAAYGEPMAPEFTVASPTGAEVCVTGYWHQPEDGAPGYVVLDVDTPDSDDADPTPLKITVNDGAAYWQGGRPLLTPADLIGLWRSVAEEVDPGGSLRDADPDDAQAVEAATWSRAADELAAALGLPADPVRPRPGERVTLTRDQVATSSIDGETELRDPAGTSAVVMDDSGAEDDAVLLDLPIIGQWYVPLADVVVDREA